MKIFCFLGVGRSGMDFFQSLFDKHPEVSQFPGIFFYNLFWPKVRDKTKIQIAQKFIDEYERYFNSKMNRLERHDKLGKNKNEHFLVSKILFKKKFVKFCKNSKNKADVFINLHLAYSAASNENILKKKIILLNIHNFEHLKDLKDLNCEIIVLLRNPISSLSSGISHWMTYSKKNVNFWWLNYQINRFFNLIENCMKLKKKIYVARLDKIHTENILYIKKISKIMNINYHHSTNKSTYHGKLWWGDILSKKYLQGYNKNFKDNYNKKNFFQKDIVYLEHHLNFYYKNYRFKKFYEKAAYRKMSILLPLKVELIVWKNLFLNCYKIGPTYNLTCWNFIQLLLFPYYWLKRIRIVKIKNKLSHYPKLI
jgi:hypothetical protein